jgi:hypothetical protein
MTSASTSAILGARASDGTETTGALYLVTARESGGRFFVGRAVESQDADRLVLEGKAVSPFAPDAMTVQPFSTRALFPRDDPRFAIQRLDHPDAIDEGTRLLTLALSQASCTSFPLMFRWFQASLRERPAARRVPQLADTGAAAIHLSEGFRRGAAALRRALVQSPQVATPRELDKLTELEGDLAIETSKCSNAIAAGLNGLLAQENELAHFLDHLGIDAFPPSDTVGGWTLVAGRLQAAKAWALNRANTRLVRELDALSHEGFRRLADLILEHESALDTLVAETLGSYGIELELWDDPEASPADVASAPLPA